MIILGIDPGTATTGYGLLDISQFKSSSCKFRLIDLGVIETKKDLDFSKRLLLLSEELKKLVKIYKPSIAAVERLFFFQNKKTAIRVSQAIGVLFLTLETFKIKIKEYSPLEIKKFIAKNGRAEKEIVEKNVCRILKIRKAILKKKCGIRKDDAVDALALAIYAASKL